MRSDRDRAILALAVSTGARAGELLGIAGPIWTGATSWCGLPAQGVGAEQWLPASPEAFVWLRLYLAELGEPLEPNDRVWWTLRRHSQRLAPSQTRFSTNPNRHATKHTQPR